MVEFQFHQLAGACEIEHLYSLLKRDIIKPDGKIDFTKKVMILVPESVTCAYEKAVIRRLHRHGLLNISVLSPKKLQKNIFASAGYGITDGDSEMNKLSKAGVITRLYSVAYGLSDKNQLEFFKKPFRMSAAQRIYDCIEELRQNGYTPDKLDILSSQTDISPLRKSKLSDLAKVWRTLDKGKKINEFDEQRFWTQMCERIPQCDELKDVHLYMYGFTFSYDRFRQFFMACKQVVASVDIAIQCPDMGKGRFEGVRRSITACIKYLSAASRETQDFTVTDKGLFKAHYGKMADAGIDYMADFSIDNIRSDEPVPDLKNVEIYQASSQYVECLHAAQKLIEWHRDGCEWNELGVICNDDATLNAMVPHVFQSAGIPFFFRTEEPLTLSGSAFYLEQCIKIITEGYRQSNVLSMLKSGYTPLDKDDIMLLQTYAMEHGIDGNKWRKPFRYLKSVPDEFTDHMEELRQRIIEPLEGLHKALFGNTAVTAKQQAEWIYHFLIDTHVYDRMKEEENEYLEKGLQKEADFVRQSWDAINHCLDTIAVESFSDEHISMQAMSAFITLILELTVIKFIPQTANAVMVDKAKMLVPNQLRRCIMLGVQDVTISPAPKILTEADKQWMEEHDEIEGVQANPFFSSTPDESDPDTIYQMYYRGIISASEKIVISSSLIAQDGSALLSGDLFNRTMELLKNKKPENIHGGMLTGEITPFDYDVAIEYLAEKLRKHKEYNTDSLSEDAKSETDAQWKKVYRYLLDQTETDPNLQAIHKALNARIEANDLPKELAEKLYTTSVTSVSELEAYAACPYQHFITHGLRPITLKDYAFTPDIKGDFWHDAIRRYIERAKQDKRFPKLERKEIVLYFNEAIAPLMDDLKAGPLSDSTLDRMKASEIIETVRTSAIFITYWLADSEFKPAECEAAFGYKDSKLPPLNIELPSGKHLSLKGKIDRYDLYTDESGKQYVRVIDYKSSSHSLDPVAVDGGYQLQLPCYLLEMKNAMPDIQPSGAFYQTFQDPTISVTTDDDAEIRDKIADKFKMSGVVLRGDKITRAMGEAAASENGETKAGMIVLDEAGMDRLLDNSKGHMIRHATNMDNGIIKIWPVQIKKSTPCKYCIGKTICGLDPRLPGGCQHTPDGSTIAPEKPEED